VIKRLTDAVLDSRAAAEAKGKEAKNKGEDTRRVSVGLVALSRPYDSSRLPRVTEPEQGFERIAHKAIVTAAVAIEPA